MTDAALDLSRYLRPGDREVWGQGCAEPQTLTELLVRQRHRLGGVTCFVGLPAAEVIRPEHTDALALESYCGTGSNVRLHEAGALVIVPVHYGALPGLLAGGRLAADAVFVQVSAPDGAQPAGHPDGPGAYVAGRGAPVHRTAGHPGASDGARRPGLRISLA